MAPPWPPVHHWCTTTAPSLPSDLRHLVRWVFFNLYVGNDDSHAKNLSICSAPGQGCDAHAVLRSHEHAALPRFVARSSPWRIGGEFRPGELTADHLVRRWLAQTGNAAAVPVAQQAREMAGLLPKAMTQAVQDLAPTLPPSARTLAGRLERFVAASTRKIAARLAA